MALTQVQPGMLGTPQPYNFKNRIINGSMVVDQRAAGASSTAGNATYTTCDRWATLTSQASKFSVQQNAGAVTPPAGFSNYLGATSSSAYSVLTGDFFGIFQSIEGFNIADLGWGTSNAKTVTLSFQVYSSLTGTFGGALKNGGANRSYPFSYTISTANTWTTISVTIAGDTSGTWATNNTVGITVQFGLGTGATFSGAAGSWASANYVSATGATSVVGTSGATFYITGVQLEIGVTATGFDYRSIGTELELCQRYFYKTFAQNVAPANGLAYDGNAVYFPITTYAANVGWGGYTFPVTMRAAPSAITVYGTTVYPSATIGQITYYNGSIWGAASSFSNVSTTQNAFSYSINGSWSASQGIMAFLAFTASAEL